jgi:hypothetical protein
MGRARVCFQCRQFARLQILGARGWSMFQVKITKFDSPYGVYLILEARFQFNFY